MRKRQIFQNRTNVIVVSAVIVLLVAFTISFSGIVDKKNKVLQSSGEESVENGEDCSPIAGSDASTLEIIWVPPASWDITGSTFWADKSSGFDLSSATKIPLAPDSLADGNIHRTVIANEIGDVNVPTYFKFSYQYINPDTGEELPTLNPEYRSWQPPSVDDISCRLKCNDPDVESCAPEDAYKVYVVEWSYVPDLPQGHVRTNFGLEEQIGGEGPWVGIGGGDEDDSIGGDGRVSKISLVDVIDDDIHYYRVTTSSAYISTKPLPSAINEGKIKLRIGWDPHDDEKVCNSDVPPVCTGFVVKYRLHEGDASRHYQKSYDVDVPYHSMEVNVTLDGMPHYFALTAISDRNLESDYSNEIVYFAPINPVILDSPDDDFSAVSKNNPVGYKWHRDGGVIIGVAYYTYSGVDESWVIQYSTNLTDANGWANLSPVASYPLPGAGEFKTKYVYVFPDPPPQQIYFRAVRSGGAELGAGGVPSPGEPR